MTAKDSVVYVPICMGGYVCDKCWFDMCLWYAM